MSALENGLPAAKSYARAIASDGIAQKATLKIY